MSDSLDKSANVILGILYISIFLVVMILAIALIIGGVSTANENINGITLTDVTVSNETGYANSSGYTLNGASRYGFVSPSITKLYNRTSGLQISTGNVSVSSLGVVTNASSVVWSNLSISYTYQYDTTNETVTSTTLESIKTNTFSMVENFFALMPTVGTILAVVILIAGIVILVLYVKKMKDSGDSEKGTYYG